MLDNLKEYVKNIEFCMQNIFKDEKLRKFWNGMAGGLFNVFVFNPFDRALYLSTGKSAHPFKIMYFKHPFQGASNAIVQRTISYGMYYPLYDLFEERVKEYIPKRQHYTVLSSVITCCFTALLTSPLSAIKMTNWNTDHKKKLYNLAVSMHEKGGGKSFFRGTTITLKREIAFGSLFGYLSFNHNDKKSMFLDIIYISLATIVASPFNYIRVMIYRSPIENTATFMNVIKELKHDVELNCEKSFLPKLQYICINKFNIGWGTLRVAIGMSISRQIYILLNELASTSSL